MKFIFILLFSSLSCITHATQNGKIQGTIHISGKLSPKHVVIYLEGQLAGNIPPPIRVEQRQQRFSPSFVVLPAGGRIAFSNDETDDINHNVFSRSRNWNMDLGLFGPNLSRTRKFPSPGRVKVYCSIHRHMKMEIFVTPNPYFAVAKEGRYAIGKIPPGEYRIKVWAQNRRLAAPPQSLVVQAGEPTPHDITLRRRGLKIMSGR